MLESDAVGASDLAGTRVLSTGPWSSATSIRFILPLSVATGSYAQRRNVAVASPLPGRTSPLWRPFPLPVEDLMPHVARYLNGPGGDASTATILSADVNELAWLTGGTEGVITIRLRGNRELPFRMVGAHLLLFALDIMMLVIDVRPEREADTDAWFDLIHYGRFFAGTRSRPIILTRPRGRAAKAALGVLRAWAPDVATAPSDDAEGAELLRLNDMAPLLEVLLQTVSVGGERADIRASSGAETAADQFRQLNIPGQMLVYSVMFLDLEDRDGSSDQVQALLERTVGQHHSGRQIDAGPRLAHTDPVFPYRNLQWLYASSEGGGFLSLRGNTSDFDRTILPAHLRSEYFLAYCFATFQRFALLRLSDEVAERALDRTRPFGDTQRRVLEFTGRCMFVQIAQSQHHHAWYSHVQRQQQVAELHQEVREEVSAFLEFQQTRSAEIRERRSRATEALVAVITGTVVPVQFVAALFPDKVKDWPYLRAISINVQAYGALLLVVALIVVTYVALRRAGRETPD